MIGSGSRWTSEELLTLAWIGTGGDGFEEMVVVGVGALVLVREGDSGRLGQVRRCRTF